MFEPKKKIDKKEDDSSEKPEENSDAPVVEIGGRGGLEPTRYGDWESGGRCVDF